MPKAECLLASGRDELMPVAASSQASTVRREVFLYCDGSCLVRQRIGGWAFLLVDEETGQYQHDADSHPRTTNNRMELTAVYRGLLAAPPGHQIHVIVDSDYVFRGMTELLEHWLEDGWSSLRKKSNPRLWSRIAQLLATRNVDCQLVRSHSGQPGNEFVDRLAREAALAHRDSVAVMR